MKVYTKLIEKVETLTSELTKVNNEKWTHQESEYTYKVGRKYIKIIHDGSAWGFIDINGDVLMAATWSRPALHARGNLLDGYEVNESVIYGPKYLR